MCGTENTAVTMSARVIQVCNGDLFVRDCANGQTVQVHTPDTRRFRAGEPVCIVYNGAMTMSIPPQISASGIRRGWCR